MKDFKFFRFYISTYIKSENIYDEKAHACINTLNIINTYFLSYENKKIFCNFFLIKWILRPSCGQVLFVRLSRCFSIENGEKKISASVSIVLGGDSSLSKGATRQPRCNTYRAIHIGVFCFFYCSRQSSLGSVVQRDRVSHDRLEQRGPGAQYAGIHKPPVQNETAERTFILFR